MGASAHPSKRIDVVQYRHLPQDNLADEVRRLDLRGVDGSLAGGASGQACCKFIVVEFDAHGKGRRYDLLRGRSCARDQNLAARN